MAATSSGIDFAEDVELVLNSTLSEKKGNCARLGCKTAVDNPSSGVVRTDILAICGNSNTVLFSEKAFTRNEGSMVLKQRVDKDDPDLTASSTSSLSFVGEASSSSETSNSSADSSSEKAEENNEYLILNDSDCCTVSQKASSKQDHYSAIPLSSPLSLIKEASCETSSTDDCLKTLPPVENENSTVPQKGDAEPIKSAISTGTEKTCETSFLSTYSFVTVKEDGVLSAPVEQKEVIGNPKSSSGISETQKMNSRETAKPAKSLVADGRTTNGKTTTLGENSNSICDAYDEQEFPLSFQSANSFFTAGEGSHSENDNTTPQNSDVALLDSTDSSCNNLLNSTSDALVPIDFVEVESSFIGPNAYRSDDDRWGVTDILSDNFAVNLRLECVFCTFNVHQQ